MQVICSKTGRGDKTRCVGLRCGGFTGFAALRCDARHLLRYGCAAAAVLTASARLLRRR